MCKIQDNKDLGYNTECKWQPDFKENFQEKLNLRTAAIAYMDDTTWIAKSKDNMQRILEEARIFYRANDSQINSSKSVLITINPKDKHNNYVLAGIDEERVPALKATEYTRFLGV